MNFYFKIAIQSLFLFLISSIACFAQKEIPELWGQRVHDEAHILKSETVDHLENELKVYEDSTSNQIAILIVQSLDGDVLEDYSIRVVEKWKLGQKDKDNGVLLLIAVDDHKMRIEVGQGLEGVLTDAQSNRIIRNEIAPNFRRGDYDAGVLAAIDGIIKSIGGEYKAYEISTPASDDDELGIVGKIIAYPILGFIYLMLILLAVGTFFNKGCLSWVFYGIFAILGGGYISNFIGTNSLFYLVPGALIAKAIVNRTPWGKRMAKSWEMKGGSGGSSSRSSWGGGGFFSGGGGGGFLGGGGSFGGGGSSGSW